MRNPGKRGESAERGDTKNADAKAAERNAAKFEELAGVVQSRLGAIIDDERMKSEGMAKVIEGEMRLRAIQ